MSWNGKNIKNIEDGAKGSSKKDAQGVTATQPQPQAQAQVQPRVQAQVQPRVQATAPVQAAGGTAEGGSDYDKILESYRELAKTQLETLDLQRTEERREASVLSDRLTRYLPYLRRAGGTEGSGLADTADIAAYNQLQNRYAEVDADYAEKQADVLSSYRQTAAAMAKEEADRKWQSQEAAADREWQAEQAEADRAWQAEQAEANRTWQTEENDKQTSTGNYTDAATALGSWFESMADDNGKIGSGDLAQLRVFADVFKENLSAADAAQLDVLLSGYESYVRNDTEQVVHDKQTAASSAQYETYLKQMAEAEKLQTYSGGVASATVPLADSAGKNFQITLDGTTYNVQVKNTTTDPVVRQAASMAGADQPFILNGHMYMMTRGEGGVTAGTVFEIEAQFWDSHAFGRINGNDYDRLYKKIRDS